jgi:hypothetical protein
MAYSIDFIKRAVEYRQAGHTFVQLREAFDIPSATYYDWEEKLNSGYYNIKIKRERRRKIDKEALKKAIEEKPDAFLKNWQNNSIVRQPPSSMRLKSLELIRI